MKQKRLPYKTFRYVYSKVPRLCVDLVIVNNDGVLLTYRQIPPAGRWHLPGGTVLFGETQEAAVKRIAREELNLEVEIEKLLGVINFDPKDYKVEIGHAISIAYQIKILGGEIKLDCQASNYKFFGKPPEKIFKVQKEFLTKNNFF